MLHTYLLPKNKTKHEAQKTNKKQTKPNQSPPNVILLPKKEYRLSKVKATIF